MSRTPLARRTSRAHQHVAQWGRSFPHMMTSLAIATAAALAVSATTARAQEVAAVADAGTGAIAGIVTNTAGAGVRGVRVRVAGQDRWVETARDGSYHIGGVPAGSRVVQFLFTDDVALAIPADVTSDAITGIEAVLPVVPRGAPLIVPATGPVVVRYGPSAVLAGFLGRVRHGGGYYYTRAQLLERGNARVTDIIRGVPGLTVSDGVVALRNTFPSVAATCEGVALYVDGTPIANDVGALSLLDARPLGELAGIEAYTREGQQLPVQAQSHRSCASVLIWTLGA